MFFNMYKYVYSESVIKSVDKIRMLKKFPSDKILVQNMPSLFCHELQLITVLFLICDSYMS